MSGSEADKSSGDEYVYMNTVKGDKTSAGVWLHMEGSQIKFQIDRGATVNIIGKKDFDKIQGKLKLRKTKKKIFAHGSNTPLILIDKMHATVERKI